MSDLAAASTHEPVLAIPPPLAWRRQAGIVLPGALVAATLDAAFAVVAYVFVLHRFSFVGALQYIASGMLGAASFSPAMRARSGWRSSRAWRPAWALSSPAGSCWSC